LGEARSIARKEGNMNVKSRLCLWVAWALCMGASAQEVKNLVNNPGFEEGVTGWSVWVEDANAGAQRDVDKNEKVEGRQSLVLDIFRAGGGMRVELHQNPFSLKAGQKLTFALWAMSQPAVRNAKLICNHREAPWTVYGFKDILIETTWKEYWTPVTLPVDDAKVGIYVELRDTKGKVWFDAVRFYEGDYVPDKSLGGGTRPVHPFGNAVTRWAELKRSS